MDFGAILQGPYSLTSRTSGAFITPALPGPHGLLYKGLTPPLPWLQRPVLLSHSDTFSLSEPQGLFYGGLTLAVPGLQGLFKQGPYSPRTGLQGLQGSAADVQGPLPEPRGLFVQGPYALYFQGLQGLFRSAYFLTQTNLS